MRKKKTTSNSFTQWFVITVIMTVMHFEVNSQSVTVYQTTKSGSQKLSKRTSKTFGSKSSGGTIVTISGGTRYQTMDGFGAAMTGSSAYLINRKMNGTQRNGLLDKLFTSKGIRLSFIRHSIGASDFSLSDYTYHDPGTTFSIDKDKDDVIPMLKAARNKNGSLKIIGTPWTAPAWMKTNFSMKEGSLKDDHFDDYALYLVRYMQAFKSEGLNIYAITMQNEPLHTTSSYPSMKMEWHEQSNLLRYHLGPLMDQNNLNTKVLLYDHNWDNTQYAKDILSISESARYASGTAFHGYAGSYPAQSDVYNHNKSKGIWFTEQSGGEWSSDFGDNLYWYSRNLVIGSIRNWSKSLLLWNLALDPDNGPKNGGCSNCRGVVTVKNDGSYTREVEYYVLGHLSKFVDPGAKRVKSNNSGDIENVAFRNPNGTFVLVAFNKSGSNRFFKVRHNNKQFGYTLPAGSLVTFKWTPSGSGREEADTEVAEVLPTEVVQSIIYPNPIKNRFIVDLSPLEAEKAVMTLVDLNGQVLYERRLHQTITEVDLEDSFSTGVYLLYIDGENFSKKMRVSIQ